MCVINYILINGRIMMGVFIYIFVYYIIDVLFDKGFEIRLLLGC